MNTVDQKIGLGPDSDQARWAIREIKSFLDSYRKWVHSLVMFGSYAMALEVYGRRAWKPVALVMNVLRKDRAITYREFQVMFPFAKKLFGECMRICGPRNPKVVESLRRNAKMYKRLEKQKGNKAELS